MNRLRILLADDHQMVREGLRLLINSQTDMQVAGEAGNGHEVLDRVRELQPEIVVLDLSMPMLNGLQTAALLRAQFPAVKVIALTVHEDECYLLELCKAGAVGYVLKRSAGNALIQAIRVVASGGHYYDPDVAGRALRAKLQDTQGKSEHRQVDLSQREREVLTLLAWGHSNKEIAADLGLSQKTVETYRSRIGEKLNLHSRTEMVQFALHQGWLDQPHPTLRTR